MTGVLLQWCESIIAAHKLAKDKLGEKGTTILGSSATEEVLLERGRFYEWRGTPEGLTYGRAKECYTNATHLAALDKRLTYVEGVAFHGILPCGHAWCVDADGRVHDPTWRDAADTTCGLCFGTGEEDDEDNEETFTCRACKGTGKAEHDSLEKAEYLGIAIATDKLLARVLKQGYYGVLREAVHDGTLDELAADS